MVGIVVGVTSFIIFLALGEGLHQNVLEEIYVINQMEVVPRTYDVGAFEGEGRALWRRHGHGRIHRRGSSRRFPVSSGSTPRCRSPFRASPQAARSCIGRRLWTELIADGIPAELIAAELPEPDDPNNAFRDWEAGPISCDQPDSSDIGSAVGCPGRSNLQRRQRCAPVACNPREEILAAPTRAAGRARTRLSSARECRPGAATVSPSGRSPRSCARTRSPTRSASSSRQCTSMRRDEPCTRFSQKSRPRPQTRARTSGTGDGAGTGAAEGAPSNEGTGRRHRSRAAQPAVFA